MADPMQSPDPEVVTAAVVEEQPAAPQWCPATSERHPPPDAPPPPPLTWREVVAVIALAALCDVTIYRGYGFAGYALLMVAAPVLLVLGSPRPRFRVSMAVIDAMLILLAARTIWLGSPLGVAAGFALLAALATALSGRRPYVLDVVASVLQCVVAGAAGLGHYWRSKSALSPPLARFYWLGVILPLVALAVFGTLFILANPDVVKWVTETFQHLFERLDQWLAKYGPRPGEILFWCLVIWIVIGLLRPVIERAILAPYRRLADLRGPAPAAERVPVYVAWRNTLLAVIVLFAVYLVFEFHTLWFREFPKRFYYGGYAHEGAAWLTAALAVATLVLSVVFRGSVLRDPRLPWLRRLAWIWSAENMVLAVTVFNRLHIYIVFNGMTRMRVVGLFGCAVVVVGFLLVVWKIARGRDFVWLLRAQLWALAIVVYLYILTPVDGLVYRWNVRHVLAGDLPPVVQISVHPIDAEGLMTLHPLVHCKDATIREGIRALLAEQAYLAEIRAQQNADDGWTTYQLADRRLLRQLHNVRRDWQEYVDPVKREAALDRFHAYVYQWY